MPISTFSRRRKQRSIEDIVNRLLKNKRITCSDIYETDNEGFLQFLRIVSESLDVKFNFPNSIPEIITKIYEKAPKFFFNMGAYSEFYYFKHPKPDIKANEISSAQKQEYLKQKSNFNLSLANIIQSSAEFLQITKDYDVIGNARSIEEEELRKKHLDIGTILYNSLKFAVKKGSKIHMLMRVIEEDGTPHAVLTAKKLLQIGVNVYNYERGEKFGTFKTGVVLDSWKEILPRLLKDLDIKHLSKDSGIKKEHLKQFRLAKLEPDYWQAVALQYYFRDKGYRCYFVEERYGVFTIYREFPRGLPLKHLEPTEPQWHKKFCSSIISNYDGFYRALWEYNHRKIRESQKMTLKYLSKF